MSCSTCGHSMAVLICHDRIQYAHCERCGTVKVTILDANPEADNPRVYVPKLVERCRQFWEQQQHTSDSLRRDWHRLGIAESIAHPENRPNSA